MQTAPADRPSLSAERTVIYDPSISAISHDAGSSEKARRGCSIGTSLYPLRHLRAFLCPTSLTKALLNFSPPFSGRSDVSGPTTTLTESLPSRSSNRSQRSPQPSSAAEIRRLFSSSHQATITALDILHSPISATTYLLSADANGLTKIWRL
jgi:hypothetical protein